MTWRFSSTWRCSCPRSARATTCPPVAKKARADESVLQIIMDVACVAAPTAQGTLDRYSHLSEKAQIANATKFLSQK